MPCFAGIEIIRWPRKGDFQAAKGLPKCYNSTKDNWLNSRDGCRCDVAAATH